MLEFFNHHSRLTAEADVVKKDERYYNLSDLLTEAEAQRIVMQLLDNSKARQIITKMNDAGITGAIAIVRRFKACNWDKLDRVPDIADDGSMNFEYVDCNHKGANRRCPFSTPYDTKPFCIVKSLFNIPNHEPADNSNTKRNAGRIQ